MTNPSDHPVDPSTDGSGAHGDATPDWPIAVRGVTESVVATLGPNERWNMAALGLHAPDQVGEPVTARTWGRTRTWRNFNERESGVIQFTTDPVEFVDAAVTIREADTPVLPGADAWVEIDVEAVGSGEQGDTPWVDWELTPVDSTVRRQRVPTINRGFGAVIDATVAASRLDVDAYPTDVLLDRLVYFAETVEKCGGDDERTAFATLDTETGWRDRLSAGRSPPQFDQ